MTEKNQNTEELYLGLDIGGTKCAVVVGDAAFSLRRKIVFDTRTERGYQAILSEFQAHIKSILADYSDSRLKRIGISCGGPLDS
ncbi:MAG: ROK family protein, partial [Bacteroidia bacterium]|nr:ROK family protein [Bacteroidia bacterium]